MQYAYSHRQPLWADRIPPMIRKILIANVAVFLIFWAIVLIVPGLGGPLATRLGFSTRMALLHAPVPHLWQFVTYMFLHTGAFHLLINMFMLWMFGAMLEARWGGREFLRFYLVCGVGAIVVHMLVSLGAPAERTGVVYGASGAVFGILAAAAVYYGNTTVLLFFVFPIRLKSLILILAVVELLSSLQQARGLIHSNVAYVTHLGGLLTGWLYVRVGGWQGLRAYVRHKGWRARGGNVIDISRRERPRRKFFNDDTWR